MKHSLAGQEHYHTTHPTQVTNILQQPLPMCSIQLICIGEDPHIKLLKQGTIHAQYVAYSTVIGGINVPMPLTASSLIFVQPVQVVIHSHAAP